VDTRGRFTLDPGGVIQGFEVLTPPVGRNVDETIRQIQAFQHVRKTKGAEATPFRVAAGQPHAEAGPGAGGTHLGGVEAGDGRLSPGAEIAPHPGDHPGRGAGTIRHDGDGAL
jgi:hypothetical protein